MPWLPCRTFGNRRRHQAPTNIPRFVGERLLPFDHIHLPLQLSFAPFFLRSIPQAGLLCLEQTQDVSRHLFEYLYQSRSPETLTRTKGHPIDSLYDE